MASLVSFCRETILSTYIKIAEALEKLEHTTDLIAYCSTVYEIWEVDAKTEARREPLSEEETRVAMQLVKD